MGKTGVVTRDGKEFLLVSIGYAGDGDENKLELGPHAKRTLWMDYSRFLVLIHDSLRLWGLRDSSPTSAELRRQLQQIKVTGGRNGRMWGTSRKFGQIAIFLDEEAVMVLCENYTKVFIPVQSFITQAFNFLVSGTMKRINLSGMQYEFSVAFEERWKSQVFWEPKAIPATAQ